MLCSRRPQLHIITYAELLEQEAATTWQRDEKTGWLAMDLPALNETVPLARVKEICEHYGHHELWKKIEADPPVKDFVSDGCTGWVNEFNGISIYEACFFHDMKYWAGYPGQEVERLVADAELMVDVARLLNGTKMAETMFHGVRIGGTDKVPTPWAWGFGRRVEEA